VFGRRWGARAEALREEVRAKLASHAHERALLADAIAKLESTLAAEVEQRADIRSSTEAAANALRESVNDHATDLAKAVEAVARMCVLLADRMETERDERRALVEAVSSLARRALESPSAIEPDVNKSDVNKPRLLGGSVYPSPPSPDGEIMRLDEAANGRDHMSRLDAGAPVRCRFGDSWIDGLEVCEVVADGTDVRYRLRRAADEYVLPAQFDRRDLEAAGDVSPPGARGRWWQS
jgi:hypothetical protein